jgi:hypothetical protein
MKKYLKFSLTLTIILITLIILAPMAACADTVEHYSQSDIDLFLFHIFRDQNSTLSRYDKDIIGIRVYGAGDAEDKIINDICKLLTELTGKEFKRYYSDDIIVDFDDYFSKQTYSDYTVGVSIDNRCKIFKINRINIDHTASQQYRITLHELLHAIGYKNHSSNPESVMFPKLSPTQELTPEDIKIIKMLYDPNLNLRNGMSYGEVSEILHK